MAMVRLGVIFSFREASCWRVEVVKGGAAFRFFSAFFTPVTVKSLPVMWPMISSTSASLASSRFFSSPWYLATKEPGFPSRSRVTSRDQYSLGTKARISFSRSTTSRVATDCTRPAERPRRTFFHSRGLSW